MATEVKFPSVGESITEGLLGVWNFSDGAWVKKGATIAEIETDKVTSEIFAEVSGRLSHAVSEGDTIKVGQVIASIDELAEKLAGVDDKGEAEAEAMAPGGEKAGPPQAWAKETEPPLAPKLEVPKEKTVHHDLLAQLSPAVRTLVADYGLEPAAITGSGKEGRLLKSDVLRAIEARKRQPTGTAVPANGSAESSGDKLTTRRPMTPLRRRIAERLVAAQNDAALLTTFNECDMTNVMNLRKHVQDRFVKRHGVKLGFMSFFVKASIEALVAVPQVNAQIDDTMIVQNHFHDIGVAISTERGLMVPVLRSPDQMTMAEIEQSIIEYAQKARAGKITLDDLKGGVFTITNGGIFGSMLSTPLLNAPQSAILGMHNIMDRPVAVNGRVEIRPMMYLALSYDHRLVDGREAVTFLVRVKEYIENPAVGLLDL